MRNAILIALAFLCTLKSTLNAQSVTCTFGISGTDHSEGHKVLQLSNGNFAVGGFINRQACLLVVDAQCNIIHQRIFNDLIPGQSRITDLIESHENQLIVVGDHCADCTTEYLPNKSFVLQTDLMLQPDLVTGVKSYGRLGCCNNLQNGINSFPSIVQGNDDNYLMVSNVGVDAGLNPQDIGVMRLNENLDTLWTKTFHNGFFESPTDVEAVGDGYVLTVPRAFSTPYLAKINNEGQLVWSKVINQGVDLYGLEATHAGNIYTAGSLLPADNLQTEVSVWSSAGDLLNSLNYGDPLQDIGRDIQQADNGRLVSVSTSVQPNIFGTYVQSRVHVIDPSILNVLNTSTVPNPNILTNVVAQSLTLSNCDGSNYAITGFQQTVGSTRVLFIHIHNEETEPFEIEAGSMELCPGESTQLTAMDADTYLWSTGETTQSIVASAPGTYSIAAQLGCHPAIAQITITGLNLPSANFSTTINGTSVQFSNNSSFGESFQWDFGDGMTGTTDAPAHQYAAGGNYEVTLVASNACGTDTTRQTIAIVLPPVAGWSQSADSGCENCSGFSVEFTATTTGNGLSYAWTFEGGIPATSTAANPVVRYTTAGVYPVTLVVSNSAGSGSLTVMEAVTVSPAAQADFAAAFDGFTAVFTNNSIHANDFLWTFGDGSSSTDPSPVHTYANPGNYTVVLVAKNECGIPSMQIAYLSIVVGLNDPEEGKSAQTFVSPNPVRNNQWLTWSGNTTPEMRAYWYDTTGKLLNFLSFSDSSPSLQAPTHSGAYLLKIILDNGVQYTCKVIVE
ncbi:MAG: PKD domain-containing protein [Saprospiraceae bacterium]|nr:PKD domain-containing protein [Saprospiraceae bacterium]